MSISIIAIVEEGGIGGEGNGDATTVIILFGLKQTLLKLHCAHTAIGTDNFNRPFKQKTRKVDNGGQ